MYLAPSYLWLFKWACFFLGLAETFNEAEGLALQTMGYSTSGSAGEEFHQLLTVNKKYTWHSNNLK
jgi:hypothetical protein